MRPARNPIIEATNFLRDFTMTVGLVFRRDFNRQGFAVWVLPKTVDSQALRRCMVDLKEHLSLWHADWCGEPLEYLSLGRFDQQTSTKLHLDGAPERSFLMLGYEPTTVRSEFQIADFSCCAHELGLTPAEFLRRHNPMFSGGAEMLKGYVTRLTDWQEDRPRIVVINNSIAEPGTAGATYGVLHGARILAPDAQAPRVINSTMMAPAGFAGSDPVMQVREFVSTDAISGRILG
ncbi:MAG TPA: hypothetical protein VGE39_26420 [Prosthecobacter sp.]